MGIQAAIDKRGIPRAENMLFTYQLKLSLSLPSMEIDEDKEHRKWREKNRGK